MKRLNIENPFFEFMDDFADLVLLNIVWLLTSIPILTFGASSTALCRIMLRKARGTCNSPVKEYFAAFREDFGKSTKVGIGFFVSGIILIIDLMYVGQSWNVWGIAIGVLCFIWFLLVSYTFPVMAQFDNTIRNTLKNAFFMAVRHFPYTIGILILIFIPVFCFLAGGAIATVTMPFYFVIGISLTVRINTAMYQNIFRRYMPE